MFFIIATIVLTSFLTLFFKVLARFGIPSFQTIVFNYWTSVITGSIVNGDFPITTATINETWFPWAVGMGAAFIFLFNMIAYTTQKFGVAVASVANKLSMVIPFIFSIYLYNEKATSIKMVGVAIALLAVVLTCLPAPGVQPGTPAKRINLNYIAPAVLFAGSGLLDTMIKYVEQGFINESNKNAYLISAFCVATIIGTILMLILLLSGEEKFDFRSIPGGICLGIANYLSIWCLIRVLKQYADHSSKIIPINNMGIVLFSTVIGWILLKERLSPVNWLGILLSLVAIALIAFG
jgi:drug/metabolite transporter (DMT)-like permease